MGGGLDKFREWFMGKFSPRIPNDLSQSVKIIIGFIVGTDGNVENVDIQYTDNVELAQIAVNIVKNAPQWTPGIHNGEPARTHYSLPIQIGVK
jgi:protein TonB